MFTRQILILISITSLLLGFSQSLFAKDLFFESAGVKIRYIDQGEGEPVVLLHGLCGDIEKHWKATGLFKPLAKDYRVIGVDLRGHGKSGRPDDPLAYGLEMAKDIIRLLDHLNIEKAHLVGFSYGGTVTLKVLATWPERLRSVALIDASWAKAGDREFVAFYNDLAKSLEEGKGFTGLLKSMSEENDSPMPDEELEKINETMSLMFDYKLLAILLRGTKELGVAALSLKTNPIPCLAIYGEKKQTCMGGRDGNDGSDEKPENGRNQRRQPFQHPRVARLSSRAEKVPGRSILRVMIRWHQNHRFPW